MGDVYIANTERIIEVQRTRELETAIKCASPPSAPRRLNNRKQNDSESDVLDSTIHTLDLSCAFFLDLDGHSFLISTHDRGIGYLSSSTLDIIVECVLVCIFV